ncbi:MAG TPA: TROVE domain-containing protein, partial [Bacteroidetes bacterium]|nr:TROVE domain-containing protein [Bacteroidota bacterium]
MRFNTTTRGISKITNHEGATAFTMSDELALYTAVASSALQDAAYEGADVRVERLQHLIRKCDPLFVAQLAVYARTSMNLRSVPLLLICELARTTNGSNLVARATDMVVQRADEITELLACYSFVNGHNVSGHIGKLSKQIQKGLASAFNRFDEYQFAKYDRKTAVTLR